MLSLIPIDRTGAVDDPLPLAGYAGEMCRQTAEWYGRGGYVPPWTSYLARENETWVGAAGFKGAPRGGRVEIAYHTFPDWEGRGIATRMVAEMIRIAREHDPALTVFAQTLPTECASTSILRKSGFEYRGPVQHPEDGEVWEWELVDRP